MSKKAKNSKKNSPKRTTPWSDVPQQLRDVIIKQPDLLQNISYGGVEKSWSFIPKHRHLLQKPMLPQLKYYKSACKTNKPHILDIKIHRARNNFSWSYQPSQRRDYSGENFVGYSGGVFMGKEPEEGWCYIWDPLASSATLLSKWESKIPMKNFILPSLLQTYRNRSRDRNLVVVTGTSHPAFLFIKVSKFNWWTNLDCTLIDPHSSTQQYMQFTNIIELEGKLYALSLQGTIVMMELTLSKYYDDYRIVDVSSSRAVPSVHSLSFKEWLIQSNGEILLVFLISTKETGVVDTIEIYRLSIPSLKWVKMGSLGDRALFFGENCCMHVSASKIGCSRNCVYFTEPAGSGWLVYDMARGDISPSSMTCS